MDGEYLDWIRGQPCATCGFPGVMHPDGRVLNDPSHIKSRGAGGGDMGNLIPQCRGCHTEMHTVGVQEFERRAKIDVRDLALRYGKKYHSLHHDNCSCPSEFESEDGIDEYW